MVDGLDVPTIVRGQVVVLEAAGEVDIATASQLADALKAAVNDHAGATRIVCDLSGVGFLDSTGLSTLAAGLRQADREGVEFCLTGVCGQEARILTLTAMDADHLCLDSGADAEPEERPPRGAAARSQTRSMIPDLEKVRYRRKGVWAALVSGVAC